jgi:FkbH-like protein
MTIEAANDFNVPRIAQMTQKTNQFNLTTKRYTDADVRSFMQTGWKIWCISVADKFGDNGITGCIMVKPTPVPSLKGRVYEIDTFLLSCRILGKGIEMAFIKKILSILRREGVKEVKANYIPTAKNAHVEDFYDKCGFTLFLKKEGEKLYKIDLAEADLEIKKYYHIQFK